MKLAELQKQFSNHIYNKAQTKIIAEVNAKKVAPKDRLQVYRNNVFGNFNSILESLYPTVKKLVGEDYFENLCYKYNQKYFSKSGNLDEYGEHFSLLVKQLIAEHKLPYLPDVAKLEWLYHFAYFAQNVPAFEVEKFQKLKEKDLFKVKFNLHPSCYLIACKHPIYSIWQFNQKKNSKKLDLKKLSKEFILVERANWQVNIHKLSEVEFLFLGQIKNGKNLYQIYQDLNKKFADFDVGSLINKYISNGVIAKYVK